MRSKIKEASYRNNDDPLVANPTGIFNSSSFVDRFCSDSESQQFQPSSSRPWCAWIRYTTNCTCLHASYQETLRQTVQYLHQQCRLNFVWSTTIDPMHPICDVSLQLSPHFACERFQVFRP